MNTKLKIKPLPDSEYSDNPDIEELTVIAKGFLPSPQELATTEQETEKISIILDKADVDYFRNKATELGASYQRMIRNLVKMYVEQQREQDKNLST
jgi:predicted DNA binding CopG/RHH family protein